MPTGLGYFLPGPWRGLHLSRTGLAGVVARTFSQIDKQGAANGDRQASAKIKDASRQAGMRGRGTQFHELEVWEQHMGSNSAVQGRCRRSDEDYPASRGDRGRGLRGVSPLRTPVSGRLRGRLPGSLLNIDRGDKHTL